MRADFTEPPTGDIHVSIEIDAPASEVYQALIKPEQLQRWIASNATVELVVGGKYDFGWGVRTGENLELKAAFCL
ncbi:MAG: SRPBCC domain-containing protein [Anaerolineae bacterium]